MYKKIFISLAVVGALAIGVVVYEYIRFFEPSQVATAHFDTAVVTATQISKMPVPLTDIFVTPTGYRDVCCSYGDLGLKFPYEIIPQTDTRPALGIALIPGTEHFFGFYHNLHNGVALFLDHNKEIIEEMQIFKNDQQEDVFGPVFVDKDTAVFQHEPYHIRTMPDGQVEYNYLPDVNNISQYTLSSGVLKNLTTEAGHYRTYRVEKYDSDTSILMYTAGHAPGFHWDDKPPKETHVVYYGPAYPDGVEILLVDHGSYGSPNGIIGFAWKSGKELYLKVRLNEREETYQVTIR